MAQESLTDLRWGLADHLGTVRDVIAYDTGINGTTVEDHMTYSAFGESLIIVDWRFGYTGKWTDAVTELLYNNARWYAAADGRWVSEDPIGLNAGANVSAYNLNQPLNNIDPSGLEPYPGLTVGLSDAANEYNRERKVEQAKAEMPALSGGTMTVPIVLKPDGQGRGGMDRCQRITFLPGTVIAISNAPPEGNYAGALEYQTGGKVIVRGINTWEQIADALEARPYVDGDLVLAAHGCGNYCGIGAYINPANPDGGFRHVDAEALTIETAPRIARRLSKNSRIVFVSCAALGTRSQDESAQKMANRFDRTIIANGGAVGAADAREKPWRAFYPEENPRKQEFLNAMREMPL